MADLFDRYREELEGAYATPATASLDKDLHVIEATSRKHAALKSLDDSHAVRGGVLDSVGTLFTGNDTIRKVSAELAGGVTAPFAELVGWDSLVDASHRVQDKLTNARDQGSKNDAYRAAWTGDVFDPATWNFGDGNTGGLVDIAAGGLASAAPVIAASVLGGPVSAAATGAAQMAGAGSLDAGQWIDSMDDLQLATESEMYRDLLASGFSTEAAREEVRSQATLTGKVVGAGIGAAGALATNYVLRGAGPGVTGNAAGRAGQALNNVAEGAGKDTWMGASANVAGKALSGFGQSGAGRIVDGAIEEGSQEVAEAVLGRAAVNAVTGSNRDIDENTLADFQAGALTGSAMGAAGTAGNAGKKIAKSFAESEPEQTISDPAKLKSAADKLTPEYVDSILTGKESATPEELFYVTRAAADHLSDLEKATTDTPEHERIKKEWSARVSTLLDGIEPGLDGAITELNEAKGSVDVDPVVLKRRIRDQRKKRANSTDPVEQQQLDDELAALTTTLELVKKPEHTKEVKEGKRDIERHEAMLQYVRDSPRPTHHLADETATGESSSTASPSPSSTSSTEDSSSDVIVRAMADLDSVSEEELDSAIQAENDPKRKQQLRRMVRSKQNQASLSNTNTGVYRGTDNYRGLNQYRRTITQSVASNNTQTARASLKALGSFRDSHNSKVQAVNEALARFEETGKPQQVARLDAVDSWHVADSKYTQSEMVASAGLTINDRSGALAQVMAKEAQAISDTYDELSAYVNGEVPSPTQPTAEPDSQSQANEDPSTDTSTDEDPGEVGTVAPPKPDKPNDGSDGEVVATTPVNEPDATQEPTVEPAPVISDPVEEAVVSTEQAAPQDTAVKDEVRETAEVETNDQDQQPEAVDNKAEEVKEVDSIKEKLDQIAEPSPLFTALRGADQIYRSAGKKSTAALARVTNFLSLYRADPDIVRAFTKRGKEPTVKESNALRHVTTYAQRLSKYYSDKLSPKTVGYEYQNAASYLLDSSGKLPENVTTAISYAAIEWAKSAHKTLNNQSNRDINAQFGFDAKVDLGNRVYQALRHTGKPISIVATAIGRDVVSVLGIKPTASAGTEATANLEASIGRYAIDILVHEGILERLDAPTIPLSDIGQGIKFVRFKPSHATTPVKIGKKAKDFVRPVLGTAGFLSSVFNPTADTKWPVTSGAGIVSDKQKGTDRGIPNSIKEANEKDAQREWRVRDDSTYKVYRMLPRTVQERLAGVDLETAGLQIELKESVEASNEGLRNEIDLFDEFAASEVANAPFQMNKSVWKIQRAGIASHINPQTSKVHRNLMAMSSWKHDVDTNAGSYSYNAFMLAAAQGLGVKVDKLRDTTSLRQIVDKLNTDTELQNLVAAVAHTLESGNELVPAMNEVLINKARSMHGFNAIVGLAQLQNAQISGKASFKSSLTIEVDGVNNGPILTLMQLGTLPPEYLKDIAQKGGFFTEDSEYTNYGPWREDGVGFDLYETLTHKLNRSMAFINTVPAIALKKRFGVLAVDNEVTNQGRDFSKNPLTQLMYGAGRPTIMRAISSSVINGFLQEASDIHKTATSLEEASNRYDQLRYSFLRTLAEPGEYKIDTTVRRLKGLGITIPLTLKSFMDWRVPTEVESLMSVSVNDSFGYAYMDAVESLFPGYLDTRTTLVDSMATAGEFYKWAWDTSLAAERIRLRDAGVLKYRVSKNNEKVLISDLLPEHIKNMESQLDNLLPVIHSPSSIKDGDLQNGLTLIDHTASKDLPNNSLYRQSLNYKERLGGIKNADIKAKDRTVEAAPMRTMVGLTHSLDSAAMAEGGYGKNDVLGIHDAELSTSRDALANAVDMNKAVFQNMIGHSPVLEVARAALRNAKQFGKLITKPGVHRNNLPSEFEPNNEGETPFLDQFTDIATGGKLAMLVNQSISNERNRLTFMKSVASVDQYSYHHGHYVVTESDIADIDKALASLSKTKAKLLAEAAEVSNVFNQYLDDVGTGNKLYSSVDIQQGETYKAIDIVTKIREKIQDNGNLLQYRLLGAIENLLTDRVSVDFVTESDLAGLKTIGTKNKAVVTSTKSGQIKISVKEAFKDDPEVLIHEFLHAVTMDVVNNTLAKLKKNPDLDTEEARVVKDLTSLYKKVLSESSPKARTHAPYLQNLDEFIVWSLTDANVQAKLRKVTAPTGLISKARDGLSAFITSVTRLVLGAVKRRNITKGEVPNELPDGTDTLSHVIEKSLTLLDLANPHETAITNTMRSMEDAEHMDAVGIFDNLPGNNDPDLRSIVAAVASKIQSTGPGNPSDSTLDSSGFRSLLAGEGFNLSEQQLYAAEQIHNAIDAAINTVSLSYRQTAKVFKTVRDSLDEKAFHDGEWALATDAQKQAAKKRYNYVFSLRTSGAAKQDHISRFMSLAATYQPLSNALKSVNVSDDTTRGATIYDRVMNTIRAVADHIAYRLTGAVGTSNANQRLHQLTISILRTDTAYRQSVNARFAKAGKLSEEALGTISESTRKTVTRILDSHALSDNRFGFISGTSKGASQIIKGNAQQYFDLVEKVRNRVNKGREGIIAATYTEARGRSSLGNVAYALQKGAGAIEKARQDVIAQTSQQIRAGFSKELTKPESAAFSSLLRADIPALLGTYTQQDITDFVGNPNRLSGEIGVLTQGILTRSGNSAVNVINKAKDTAYFMATGINRDPDLMLNAHLIVNAYSQQSSGDVDSQTGHDLDLLISLMALKYTPSATKLIAHKVMVDELAIGDRNGVSQLLDYHKHYDQQALNLNFGGDRSQMIKGYLKDINNPYRDVAFPTSQEIDHYKQKGYSVVHRLTQDTEDTSPGRVLMVRDGVGLLHRVTGTVSLTRPGTKGYQIGIDPVTGMVDGETVNRVKAIKKVKAVTHSKRPVAYDPVTSHEQHLVPIRDPAGNVSGFRYIMDQATRDTVLDRHNDVADVMGAMVGGTLDKSVTPTQNSNVIKALHDQFNKEYLSNPDKFMKVSADSEDRAVRETFKLLPEATRQQIRELWGQDALYVHKQAYYMHFGFRKRSITEPFYKDDSQAKSQGIGEKVFVNTMEAVLGKRAGVKLRRVEDIHQGLVKLFADMVVIRNLTTTLDNSLSNTNLLLSFGVSSESLPRRHKEGVAGFLSYVDDHRELLELQTDLDSGVDKSTKTYQRVAELRDALARNPIKPLVDAGMLLNIVEDIDNTNDTFTFKSDFNNWVEGKTSKVSKPIKDLTNFALVNQNTKLYKLLYKGTTMGDFVARYVLYKHFEDQGPITDKELAIVDDAFVNYDTPSHPSMQYLNDSGLWMFTKYYIRMQRVLMKLLDMNAARTIGVAMLSEGVDMPNITDITLDNKIGGPSLAELNIPAAVEGLLPIRAGMSLID